MSNKSNFSRRSFLKAVGAITVGSTAGSMLVPQATAKAASAFTTDAESSIEIVKSSTNFQSLLQQLQGQGFSTIDPVQLKFEGEFEPAQTQGAQGMQLVTLNSSLNANVAGNANIGCVVDLAHHELHSINCFVTKNVGLEELDVERILIFGSTDSWDRKAARLILPSTTLDDSIRTPNVRSLRDETSPNFSSTEPAHVQVVEADGFTVQQTTVRVQDLSALSESQLKALADIDNTSVGRLSGSPHAAPSLASCATYSDYTDSGWSDNGSCGATNCWICKPWSQWYNVCRNQIRQQCLRYHYANCSVSIWNCWMSTQQVWSTNNCPQPFC